MACADITTHYYYYYLIRFNVHMKPLGYGRLKGGVKVIAVRRYQASCLPTDIIGDLVVMWSPQSEPYWIWLALLQGCRSYFPSSVSLFHLILYIVSSHEVGIWNWCPCGHSKYNSAYHVQPVACTCAIVDAAVTAVAYITIIFRTPQSIFEQA